MPPLADPCRQAPPAGRPRKDTHPAAAATVPPASQERRTAWDIMGYHGIAWASMESAGMVARRNPRARGCQQLLTVVKLKDSLPSPGGLGIAARAALRRCPAASDRLDCA